MIWFFAGWFLLGLVGGVWAGSWGASQRIRIYQDRLRTIRGHVQGVHNQHPWIPGCEFNDPQLWAALGMARPGWMK